MVLPLSWQTDVEGCMAKVSVILVDDEVVTSRVFGAAVVRAGFQTAYAGTASDALEMIREYQPGLVISDVQMPGVDGFEFVREMGVQGIKTMPVIYLTGLNNMSVITDGLSAGGDDFILKGSAIKWINDRVNFWIGGGFVGLPYEIRRRAMIAAKAYQVDTGMEIGENVMLSDEIFAEVARQLQDELQAVPKDYGTRLIERLMFMGRLSKLTFDACRGFGDYLRFPDYVVRVTYHLKMPWARELAPLLKYFDQWSIDIRFVRSGIEPLAPVQDYAWFRDGMDLM